MALDRSGSPSGGEIRVPDDFLGRLRRSMKLGARASRLAEATRQTAAMAEVARSGLAIEIPRGHLLAITISPDSAPAKLLIYKHQGGRLPEWVDDSGRAAEIIANGGSFAGYAFGPDRDHRGFLALEGLDSNGSQARIVIPAESDITHASFVPLESVSGFTYTEPGPAAATES